MTILKTSFAFVFLLTVVSVLLFGLVAAAADETCTYARCEARILERLYGTIIDIRLRPIQNGHNPCGSTTGRELMRSFDCADNNTYHICCEDIDFESVEENQAKGFTAANSVNEMLCPEARSCTKRILCEQSCQNDCPQLDYHTGDGVSKEVKQLVHSYSDDQACYRLVHSTSYRPAVNQYTKFTRLDTEECQADCAKKYANCQPVLDTNFIVKCYHEASRLFHKLGLSFFTVFRMTFDSFRNQRELSVHETIKSAFTDLHRRMVALDKEYNEWYDREVRQKRCKRSSIMLEKTWKRFLFSKFGGIHYKLANSLYDSLSYSQFNRTIAIINQTLLTTVFDVKGLKTPCHYG